MKPTLYKYRGISNFRYFVDIIMKNRLYASKYTNMNDPMEGQYYFNNGEIDKSLIDKISSEKDNFRICSLSRTNKNELMWAHYAEGHRGVAIGLSVDNKYDIRPIQYTGLSYLTGDRIENDTPREILSHKLEVWSYEEEERVFTTGRNYIEVSVTEIVTAKAMSNQDFSFISELANKFNPDIEIIKANSLI